MEGRPDIRFYGYPLKELPNLSGYTALVLDAPPLTEANGLLLLDATWRYAEGMLKSVEGIPGLIYRSLPTELRTAYPRYQTACTDPDRGLASIEALYAAYRLLGWDVTGLLDHYYWKEQFLEKNPHLN